MISQNNTVGCGGGRGGGIACTDASPQIINCTLSGNAADTLGGAMYLVNNSQPSILNTIVEGTIRGGGIYFENSPLTSLTYCDFYANTGGNFTGTPLANLGQLVFLNANGDSCDIYHNILLDPTFVNSPGGNYHLQSSSPCIDAGNPGSPLDPDSTIADIGAYYFDQASMPPVSIALIPVNPPIQIPATGGSFNFNATLTNHETTPQTFETWIMVQLPNLNWYGPVLGPASLTLPVGASITRLRTQNVPGGAPMGTYLYRGYIGDYGVVKWDSSGFDFTKLGVRGWESQSGEWVNVGESLEAGSRPSSISPSTFELHPCHPNPFNSTTSIRFDLAQASQIKLAIFDVGGRAVNAKSILSSSDNWMEAGTHDIRLDFDRLTAGLYFAQISIGGQTRIQKLLLLK